MPEGCARALGPGPFQATPVKDAARGGWAFYQFDGAAPAKMVPKGANCYSCHRDNGAVDTTFVQFYPTLIPVAKKKNTFRFDVMQDGAKPAQ
ncbi:MAG: cytochrome P460 family protein [Terriglobales bacterium]